MSPVHLPEGGDPLGPPKSVVRWVSTGARLVLGGVLVVAGVLKIADPQSSVLRNGGVDRVHPGGVRPGAPVDPAELTPPGLAAMLNS